MAYEKHTWSCGETVTADLLNHLEEGVEAADPGYECVETNVTVFEGSVTTSGETLIVGGFTSSAPLSAERILVTFDGVEYWCEKRNAPYGDGYGNIDQTFSDYPFMIIVGNPNGLFTKVAGTYSVKIEQSAEDVSVTECFGKAVEFVVGESVCETVHLEFNDTNFVSSDKTFEEVQKAIVDGKAVFAWIKVKGTFVYDIYISSLRFNPSGYVMGNWSAVSSNYDNVEILEYRFVWDSGSDPTFTRNAIYVAKAS